MGAGRDVVFDAEDGAAGHGRENGADAFDAVLEVTFVRGIVRHLNNIDLPLAFVGVTKPEMPFQTTFGGVGEVTKLQAAWHKCGGNGKAVGRIERGGVDVKVDIEVLQEQTRGKGADKVDLGTPLFPTFAKTRVTKQGMRGLGCTFRTLNQGVCRVG